MRILFSIITIIIVITCNIFSQRVSSIDLLPQGNPLTELNSLGISGLQNSVYNIGAINPAAISNFENVSLGFSYQFQNKLKKSFFVSTGFQRHNNFIPQSAGLIFPFGKFRAGISMTQAYNGGLISEPLAVTTADNPDGNGQYIIIEAKNILYKYSLLASYSFEEILEGLSISLGGRFNINKFTSGRTDTEEINLFFSGNNWELGTTIKKNFAGNRSLQFGLFYEKNVTLNNTGNEGPELYIATPDPNPNRPPPYFITTLITKLPAKLKFDFYISVLPSIKFLGSVSEIFWIDVDTDIPNQIEFAGSVVYKFSGMFSTSLGFFSTKKKYNKYDNIYYYPNNANENLKAVFVTLGTRISFNNFIVDIAIADSHLLSGDWRKQTIGKIGIGYQF